MSASKHLDHARLQRIYFARQNRLNRHFNSRMRRALSWLERAEQETDDPHAGYIFYWISLNAGYLPQLDDINQKEAAKRRKYFNMISECDSRKLTHELVWQKRNVEIKRLLKNEFIYGPFWEVNDPISNVSWKPGFRSQGREINKAFKTQNTAKILNILFGRLYVLRNQLIHGNATWQGSRNRRQVEDGYKIISKLQHLFLLTMLNNPNRDWGKVSYDLYAEGFDDY